MSLSRRPHWYNLHAQTHVYTNAVHASVCMRVCVYCTHIYVVPDLRVCEHLRNTMCVCAFSQWMKNQARARGEKRKSRYEKQQIHRIFGQDLFGMLLETKKRHPSTYRWQPIPTLFLAARALHNWLLRPMTALHHSIPWFEMSRREDIKKKCSKDLKGPVFMQSAKNIFQEDWANPLPRFVGIFYIF